MKFSIHKEELLEILQKISGPATFKQNFPILNSVFISNFNKKLKFITTDLDVTIITTKEANIIESGKIVVPIKRFLPIIKEFPSLDINIELIKNNLLIKCEKIEFKINTLNPEEFPQIEEEKEVSFIKINSLVLTEMIQLTSFCVGYEDTNYVLNGIFFEIFNNKINLVATDGKRLSFITRKLPQNQPEIKTKISFILPIKAINELFKLIKEKDEDILLFIKENKIGFDLKDTQFIARPIEGEFPNYTQYIPQENKDKLIINKQNFLEALRRADVLSTVDHRGIKLDLKKDTLVISKTTPQMGEAKEVLKVNYSGSNLEIGFNPHYLIDILKNLSDEEVSFEFFGSEKPAVLRKEDYVYLVLPMKI